MKISNETTGVLKNFSSINQSIFVQSGSALSTISPMKTVFAKANVEEEFPREFGIYDLNQFLAVVSLFEDPEFSFDENNLNVLGKDDSTVRYFYANKNTITLPPEKELELTDVLEDFSLSEKRISSLLRAATVMQLPHICISGENGELFISAEDVVNNSSNNFKFNLNVPVDTDFKAVFRVENLKLLPKDYVVTLSRKGIAKFTSEDNRLSYFIVAERNSSW